VTDRIEAMRCFVTVCDDGGFSAAARRLGLSASKVTRSVSDLERLLGARLLQRNTRAVRPTEVGETYLRLARGVLERLVEAECAVVQEAGILTGRVVVAVPPMFGRMHAAPVVAAFMRQYPRVQVELRLSSRQVRLIPEGVDCAIRIGHLSNSSLIACSLGQTRQVLAASPDYLACRGQPATLDALNGHSLLSFEGVAHRKSWVFVDKQGATLTKAVDPVFFSDDPDVAITIAAAGGGIVSALHYQIASQLEAGVLCPVLETLMPPPVPIHVLLPENRLVPPSVRALVDLFVSSRAVWSS